MFFNTSLRHSCKNLFKERKKEDEDEVKEEE